MMKRILILALVLLITGGGAVAAYGEDGSQLWLRLDAVGATSAITGVKGVAMTELQTYWQGGPVTLKRQKGMARDGYTIKSQGENKKKIYFASQNIFFFKIMNYEL